MSEENVDNTGAPEVAETTTSAPAEAPAEAASEEAPAAAEAPQE